MNTNSNVYTVIYTTIIVVVVAAVLAFASSSLKSKQTANIKAETLSQMMTAAGLGDKESFSKMGNDAVLSTYSDNIEEAFAINVNGEKVRDLKTAKNEIELIDNFKPENKAILNGGEAHLPVYKFKSGVTVIPVYGAGLWGPIWGYIALQQDLKEHISIMRAKPLVSVPRLKTRHLSKSSLKERSLISRILPYFSKSSKAELRKARRTRLTPFQVLQ